MTKDTMPMVRGTEFNSDDVSFEEEIAQGIEAQMIETGREDGNTYDV